MSRRVIYAMAVASAASVLLFGCGQKQTDAPVGADEPAPTPTINTTPTENGPVGTGTVTNSETGPSSGFVQTLQESPFGAALPALKESYASALIAFEIGDYARAFTELDYLGNSPDLEPMQAQAVADLLSKIKEQARAMSTNVAKSVTATNPTPATNR